MAATLTEITENVARCAAAVEAAEDAFRAAGSPRSRKAALAVQLSAEQDLRDARAALREHPEYVAPSGATAEVAPVAAAPAPITASMLPGVTVPGYRLPTYGGPEPLTDYEREYENE